MEIRRYLRLRHVHEHATVSVYPSPLRCAPASKRASAIHIVELVPCKIWIHFEVLIVEDTKDAERSRSCGSHTDDSVIGVGSYILENMLSKLKCAFGLFKRTLNIDKSVNVQAACVWKNSDSSSG
jgi:hypothetical protein